MSLAAAVFALLSFLSFQPGDLRGNLGGPVGYGLSSVLLQTFGLAVYLLPALFAGLATRLFQSRLHEITAARALAAVLLVLSVAVMMGLLLHHNDVVHAGGWLGGFLGSMLHEACGSLGAYVVAGVLFLLTLMFTTGSSLRTRTTGAVARIRTVASEWREKSAGRRTVVNRRREPAPADDSSPIIVLGDEAAIVPEHKVPRPVQGMLPFFGGDSYQTPSLSLLDTPRHSVLRFDQEALRKSSEILENKLANFGIEGKVVAVRPGPVITTFEIEPAPGVKVNRIATLQDDLAMALRAVSVRILAPVPGKAVVGIEVANPKREQVFLKEIIESQPFVESASMLSIALGKDSVGSPLVADLARMPHLLIAGATGTGKSVSLNAMIMSILYKSSPRDVRFVMIDLKMLELSLYEGLPHLLVPVVTDPKTAVTGAEKPDRTNGSALPPAQRERRPQYRQLQSRTAV